MLGCDSSGSSDSDSTQETDPGEEIVKWEVKGAVMQGSSSARSFNIDWSITYPNGGVEDVFANRSGDELPWTKEETLDDGTEVTLAIDPNPDTVDPKETYTFDFELRLFSNGAVVAALDTVVQVPPDYADGDYPDPSLKYVVGN